MKRAGILASTVSMVDGSIVLVNGDVADIPEADSTLICVVRPEACRMLALDAGRCGERCCFSEQLFHACSG
ncbi:MAG: hypothetical protein Q9M23_02200 [Mariprofundaceae bacterium]|nr:hypothetical protein [Mariprofundaceae bacterium]